MARRVLITLLAVAALAALSAGPGGAAGFEPRCAIGLEQGRESHSIRFHTRCNFKQLRVTIDPDRRLAGVDRHPGLSGRVDPEDSFRCSRSRGHVECTGRAGQGARLDGRFDTRKLSCEVTADASVTGGVDCEPGQACIEIAYQETASELRPRGC